MNKPMQDIFFKLTQTFLQEVIYLHTIPHGIRRELCEFDCMLGSID